MPMRSSIIADGRVANKGSRDEILPAAAAARQTDTLPAAAKEANLTMNSYDLIMDLVGKVSDIRRPAGSRRLQYPGGRRRSARQNSENIEIITKTDKPGIDIMVKPGTKGETVYIPAVHHPWRCGRPGLQRLLYRGRRRCHHCSGLRRTQLRRRGDSQHNGIHRFFLAKNSKVLYLEKHYR